MSSWQDSLCYYCVLCDLLRRQELLKEDPADQFDVHCFRHKAKCLRPLKEHSITRQRNWNASGTKQPEPVAVGQRGLF